MPASSAFPVVVQEGTSLSRILSAAYRVLRRASRHGRFPGLAWGVLAGLVTGWAAQAATLKPLYPAYHPEETVTIEFTGGPGGAKDWIGVFPSDVAPEDAPGPEAWAYVDGSQNGLVGVGDGSVALLGGLPYAGAWTAYLFVDDTFTSIASSPIVVLNRDQPILRAGRRSVPAHTPFAVNLFGGPGNPKDWIGVYRAGQVPGTDAPALRAYVDGTPTGEEGLKDATIFFSTGLRVAGRYDVHLFRNDGNEVLASDTFEVTPGVDVPPALGPVLPLHGSTDLPPVLEFSAVFTNGTSVIVPASVRLTLDGNVVPATVTLEQDLVWVRYASSDLPVAGPHTWQLSARDDATPVNTFEATSTIEVGAYTDLRLPAPVHFLDFDSVPEGSLPVGWTQESYSSPVLSAVNFQSLGSAAYSRWTSVRASRFNDLFAIYGDSASLISDYVRVLSPNPFNVVEGRVYAEPLPRGNFLFANSGFQRRTGSQVLYLFTSGFNLSGQRGVHLGFRSVWEQNENSIASVEYSIDGGTTWLPVAYYLDSRDIVMAPGGAGVDAVATFSRSHADVARYADASGNEVGGNYGAFIGARVTSALAPHVLARIDDDPVGSKRIELFPLPQADNQPDVRFRFAHAGADSWYFGIDDFGLYSMEPGNGGAPTLTVTRSAAGIVLSWPAGGSGDVLETTLDLGGTWSVVSGVVGNTHTVPAAAARGFFRLRR